MAAGNLSLIVAIQTEIAAVQNAVNNLNQAITAQGGALISTSSLQSALTTITGTINTAVATAANNTIVGNQ